MICPTQHYEGIHILFETRVPYLCLLPLAHPLTQSKQALDLARLVDEEFVMLYPGYMEQEFEDEALTRSLRKNTRIVARSDLAIAEIARSTGLPTLVDPYSARIAVALGGVVALPVQQQIHYPIAIISRGTETMSLAANLFAQALIAQFRDQL